MRERAALLNIRLTLRNTAVVEGLCGGKICNAELIVGLVITVYGRRGIGVSRHNVNELCLLLKEPLVLGLAKAGGHSVHTARYGTGVILSANGIGNRRRPHICLVRSLSLSHTVGLVTEVPHNNSLLVLQLSDEAVNEASHPHKSLGICYEILTVKNGRTVELTAHPARNYRNNELNAVLLCRIAEVLEVFNLRGINTVVMHGLTGVGIHVFAVTATELISTLNRLKIAPVGEHAHTTHAVLVESLHLLTNLRTVVMKPHFSAPISSPIITSKHKLFHNNILAF